MTYEQATLVAIVLGPTLAVLISLWHEERMQKRTARMSLFMTIMAHRKSSFPTYDWANALNLIDVVYAAFPKVVTLWHEVYTILLQKPTYNAQQFGHKYMQLLSEMGRTLGYKDLEQVDIDKFYSPQAHGSLADKQSQLLEELLRVLKGTESLSATPKKNELPPIEATKGSHDYQFPPKP